MSKLTFREALEKGLPWYKVSKGGAILSFMPRSIRAYDNDLWIDDSSKHLTNNGKIDRDWGYALFANAEDAAEVAKSIITTKYNNSLAKIKKVTGF